DAPRPTHTFGCLRAIVELRLPRPDLSVLPGHEVAVGAEVMFHCTITQPSTGCFLYLEGQIRAQQFHREQGDYSFSLVQKGDSGRYSCQCYALSAWREWSAVTLINTLPLGKGKGTGSQTEKSSDDQQVQLKAGKPFPRPSLSHHIPQPPHAPGGLFYLSCWTGS
uniref:Uncharacterized protein n=1 Tax=Serinus canaria TaxID=9135 RepID=A0A8C9N9D2_SERCA